MKKRFRKAAAALLVSAMLFQQCDVRSLADDAAQTELSTEDKAAAESEKARKESEKAAAESEKAREESEKAAAESEKAREESEKAAESEKAKAESEKAAAEAAAKAESERVAAEEAARAESERASEAAAESERLASESEKMTEKQSETQTEPKQTEAQTEPKQTEAQTEPKQTEAQTEVQETEEPDTEEKTEKETEKKEKKEEKEKETEASDRKNDGEKVTDSMLVSGLSQALPYLIAADSVDISQELAEDQKIARGEEGAAVVGGLSGFSKKLANGRSTSTVKVINIYADKEGKLDEKQLKKAFPDKVIDVTDQHVLVNIIAAKADQALSFSGYTMTDKGQTVSYEETSQAGDILYNFAALDGKSFTEYKGSLTLSGSLQGTFLAPGANVELQSDLAGAVYASGVTVGSGVSELKRIVLINGSPEEEEQETEESVTEASTETGTEAPETEALTENETEAPETEALTETETEAPETEALTENETEAPETEASTETETEQSMTEALAETETEVSVTEASTETVTEALETEASTETEAVTATEVQETETAPETEALEDAVPLAEMTGDEEELVIDDGGALAVRNLMWYSETGISMAVRLVDGEDEEKAALSTGKIVVKAAETVYDNNGNVVFAKDAEAAAYNWAGTSQNGSLVLNYGGSYYLEVTEVPDSYLVPSRIYFKVDAAGKMIVETGTGWFGWENDLMTIPLQKNDRAQVILSLTGEDHTTRLTGAAFVVKDSNGAVICDGEGQPKYYINYNGKEVGLKGLAAGTYYLTQVKAGINPANADEKYQVAADTEFTIDPAVTEPVELKVTNVKLTGEGKTLALSAHSLFNKVVLTAEKEQQTYLALYSDAKRTIRVSEVKCLTYKAGGIATDSVTFEGLAAGTYYLGATDEFGEAPKEPAYSLRIADKDAAVTFAADKMEVQTEAVQAAGGAEKASQKTDETQKTEVVNYVYGTYPSGAFSYEAEIHVTMEVKDKTGKEKKTSEIFYADLFSDSQLTKKVLVKPLVFEMKNTAAQTVSAKVKMTEASGELYLAETDKNGKLIDASLETFKYTITTPAQLAVTCGTAAKAVILNQLKASVVKIRVEDSANGKILSGAKLVMKDKKTGSAISINKIGVFSSDSKDIVREDIPVGTYLLSEITAPSGYTCTPDMEFTVEEGRTTEVVLKNAKTVSSDYSLSVLKQVYCGDKLLYARDNTNGQYASEGRYTFYAALFADAARTQKISDVQKITVSGLGGTTVFKNLVKDGTYYVAETNAYGTAVSSYKGFTVSYADGGRVTMSNKSGQAVIRNVSESLPTGYRHTGTLTITKKLQTATGQPEAVTKTFYAGIYRNADYSDKPTIVELKLQNASEVSSKRRILLSGTQPMTYYIAEVDANGNRITGSSDFGYTVTVDQPTVAISGGDDKNVTITNKTKVSKVTLYLTKRVYQGTSQKAVNATFYAGLFKDPEFTQLYAKPIPLKLENKSEITLKLSLNLGSASEATIYVAEVDENGKLVKEGKSFGYEVRVINSTAAFTQERTEIQSILLNSIYGSTSSAGWDTIASGNNPIGGTGGSGGTGGWGGGFSGNGSSGDDGSVSGGSSSVRTGDETPVLPYVLVLVVSGLVLVGIPVWRRKKKKA